MTFMFYTTGVVVVLFLLALAFVRADAASVARVIGLVGPALLGLAGVGLLLVGRVGLAGAAFSGAAAWYLSGQKRRAARPSPGKRSTVRSAAFEMELDHDSGALAGIVLAGRFEGRQLASLSRDELLALHAELSGEADSLQLLEAYLDGRFPGWRDGVDAHVGGRERSAPGTGAMTEQEAYQILGLEAGASTADIRKAHRRLMQRVHPDLGGSSFLAARINEAKDVLLNGHD
jgi:DnaJ-domain-containing protein 1